MATKQSACPEPRMLIVPMGSRYCLPQAPAKGAEEWGEQKCRAGLSLLSKEAEVRYPHRSLAGSGRGLHGSVCHPPRDRVDFRCSGPRKALGFSQVPLPLASQRKGPRNLTGLRRAPLGPWKLSSWGGGAGLCWGHELCQSGGSRGRAESGGIPVGHQAGGPLPHTGPSPASLHRCWLGQVLTEAGRQGRLALGS